MILLLLLSMCFMINIMTYYMIQRLYNRSSLSENPYAQSELQRKVSVQSLKQELVENISTELTIDNQQLRLMDCIGEGKKQEAALVSVTNVCYTNIVRRVWAGVQCSLVPK